MHEQNAWWSKLNGILLKERKKKPSISCCWHATKSIKRSFYMVISRCIVPPTEQVCTFICGFTFALFMRGIVNITHEQRNKNIMFTAILTMLLDYITLCLSISVDVYRRDSRWFSEKRLSICSFFLINIHLKTLWHIKV